MLRVKFYAIFLFTLSFLFISEYMWAMPPDMRGIEACEPNVNSCEFYRCRENHHVCGSNGYYIGFGHKFCQEYIDLEDTFKPKTQVWLAKVRSCLQEKLSLFPEGGLCSSAGDFAFSSHSDCYMEAGVCELQLPEFYKVLKVIKGNILRPEIFKEGLEVMLYCAVINGEIEKYRDLNLDEN